MNSIYANLFGTGCIIGAILLAIWRIIVWYKAWSVVSFEDAIKKLAETGYYNTSSLAKMWEHPSTSVTQHSYYRNMLIQSIEDQSITLYGDRIFPPTKKQKIDLDVIYDYNINEDGSSIVSPLGESMYEHLSFKMWHLKTLIKKKQNKMPNLLEKLGKWFQRSAKKLWSKEG